MSSILEDIYSCPLMNESLTEIKTDKRFYGSSGYNANGDEIAVPGGLVNAMIKLFLSDDIGLGVTEKGEIYVEAMGDDRENRVGLLYSTAEKTVKACRFNINDITTKQSLVNSTVKSIPYSVALPYLAELRIVDKYNELTDAWNEIISESEKGYMPMIPDCQGSENLIDSFVSSVASDYPITLGSIENLAVVPGEVYDYTTELLGKEGRFLLTKGIPKPDGRDFLSNGNSKTYQQQMNDLREEVFPLVKDYYESLSEEEKALIPDEEKLGIYIPTTKFKNVVRIIADGIRNGEKDSQNVLLKGPPGVGKSTMAVAVAYVFRMPYRFTQSYKTADASEYIGTTVADNGVLKTNIETQFAQTVLHGGVHMDDDNSAIRC